MSASTEKNPDHLLTLIKKDEQRGHQGTLKVFLGMVAGVGKTFAMLQAAKQVKARGVDIVVGLVEHHGRQETAALLEGLALLPRKKINYKGVEVEELDLDAVLARKPRVVLVDELAHTNVPGSRHSKRYLDVLEILDAGIDVYTTLNVQHIESRIDTVREITQITVHETVPDGVLDRADEIVLIDLPPEELLKRLSEGRIYAEASAQQAAQNFFKRGNLTALREMALRIAAERVDRDLRAYKTLHGIDGVWKAGGRLMVAIFASPYSEVLIRWTRRVADLLGVTWIGAYVESDKGHSEDEQKLLAKNIALVEQIGGDVVSTRDDDPVKGLLRIARQHNVTLIIVGKSQRCFLRNLLAGGSLVNRLLRQSGHIDVYTVATSRAKGRQYLKKAFASKKPRMHAQDLGWLVAIVIGTWGIAAGLEPFIGYMAVGIVFLLAVSLSGLFLSRAAVFILAFTFAFIHNFLFIPPRFTVSVSKPEDFMLLFMFFVAAAVIGHLTTRLSQKERVLRSREDRANLLYNLTKQISSAQSLAEITEHGQNQLEDALGLEVALLIPYDASHAQAFRPNPLFTQTENEQAVAQWVLENGKIAGRGTDTLAAAAYTYIPIIGSTGVLGVAAFHTRKGESDLTPDQLALIETFLRQIASGMEREAFHSRVKTLLVVEETQKLYKSLLDCVSHELKTPLAAIKGAASAIVDPKTKGVEGVVDSLGHQILDASERLQRLVENLLDMTRIESGHMRAKRVLCDVGDIIATAVRGLETLKGARELRISVPASVPPILCDPVLVNQALINIVHNAFVYTPPASRVDVSAALGKANDVEITVRDYGKGLPKDNPSMVLEKFFRAEQGSAGGVGLGLSIAKGFIEAQGGSLEALNHPDGGAVFIIRLTRGQLA